MHVSQSYLVSGKVKIRYSVHASLCTNVQVCKSHIFHVVFSVNVFVYMYLVHAWIHRLSYQCIYRSICISFITY